MKQLRILFTALAVMSVVINGSAQDKQEPDEQITVNKKYDENGNLIQFDSTYVHKWSSDSTLQFSFPDNDFFAGKRMPDMEEFFNEFFNDSVVNGLQGQYHFHYPFFDDEEFMNRLKPFFDDSLFSKHFSGDNSFLDNFGHDSLYHYPQGFGFANPDDLRKHFDEQLNRWYGQNNNFHEFKNPQEKEEWDKLMEKHQKEIDAFRKKWNDEKGNP